MSSYRELVKNFEKIRSYMREFYVYGFKSRTEYDRKSARLYDDERRRMESWLGEHMRFVRTSEGKNMFISIDSRVSCRNPLYKALKAKSFTSGDITLHFILFDILHSEGTALSLSEIMQSIDGYLGKFDSPMLFDESTVRKKLKEYVEEGIITVQRAGKKLLYSRSADPVPLTDATDALKFSSEAAPCGVIGSFLLDRQRESRDFIRFKHHYITSALDSDVTASLFCAMREKRLVTVTNLGRGGDEGRECRIVPLRIFLSVQSGRQHLLAYNPEKNAIMSYRIDYLSDVRAAGVTPRFDELRSKLDAMQKSMWGVTAGNTRHLRDRTEHVEFTVKVADGEEHIVRRLMREKRNGRIEKLDGHTYRFSADVYDTGELHPWIRTCICRITHLEFSNRTLQARFLRDMREMYRMYGIGEVEE